jgi:hypothetical protein
MKLTDLKPRFVNGSRIVASKAEANELIFVCPKCKSHLISVPFAKHGVTGNGHANLNTATEIVLDARVKNKDDEPCGWRGHIVNGEVAA